VSENGCVLCKKVASGEEKLEAVYLEEWSVTHSIGGEALAHVLVIPRDHVPSAKEMGRLPEDREKTRMSPNLVTRSTSTAAVTRVRRCFFTCART
jgi:hypothetical protein